MLRLAACLEEHFPHYLANAVVKEAKQKGLDHNEYHSKVEYTVAHGIKSTVNGRRLLLEVIILSLKMKDAQSLKMNKINSIPFPMNIHIYIWL